VLVVVSRQWNFVRQALNKVSLWACVRGCDYMVLVDCGAWLVCCEVARKLQSRGLGCAAELPMFVGAPGVNLTLLGENDCMFLPTRHLYYMF